MGLHLSYTEGYVYDLLVSNREDIGGSMGPGSYPLVNGHEHEMLLSDDLIKLGVIESVDPFWLPGVVLAEELEHISFRGDYARGEPEPDREHGVWNYYNHKYTGLGVSLSGNPGDIIWHDIVLGTYINCF